MKKIILFLMLTFAIFAEDIKIFNRDINYENTLSVGNPKRLKNQVKTTLILAVGTLGTLYLLPESFTGWDRSTLNNIFGNYTTNMGKRGVVWDPDDAFFNFVAHPYVGSCYYIAARKSGYNEFQSFLFSFGMSAVLWEMGIEAISQAPSIQDMIITPGIGSVLGECLYRIEGKIIDNNGKIGESKFAGKVALFLIDPIGSVSNIIGYKDNEVQGFWSFSNGNEVKLNYNFRVQF